jgi:predicted permease
VKPPRFWRAVIRWSVGADRRDGWSLSRWLTPTDVRVALRLVRRQPVATAASILALGTAIAVSVAAFTFARGFVFPDLGIQHGDRLMQVRMNRAAAGSTEHPRPAEVLAWIRGARTVESAGAFQYVWPALQIGEEPAKPIDAARITPGPFARISPPPLLGRHLTDADAAPGADPVIVISESFWQRRFAADPGIVGRWLRLNGERHAIVGVTPASWTFPVNQHVWLPLSVERLAADAARALPANADPMNHRLVVWTMLAGTATRESSAAELESLARGAVTGPPEQFSVSVMSYVDGFTNGLAPLAATVVLVLLLVFLAVVSLNVATLVLARCAARAGELAVRSALGASRIRIVAQLFVESLVLGVTASALGTYGVYRGLDWARTRMGGERPFWLDLSVDPAVMIYAAVLAVLASALAGVVPALQVTRGDSASHLQAAGPRLVPVALGRFTSTLVAVQLAVSLGLFAVAGLLAEGLAGFSKAPRGLHDTNILTAVLYRDPNMAGRDAKWGSPELQRLRIDIEGALRQIPGAESAAVSLSLPRTDASYDRLQLDDSTSSQPARVQDVVVGPRFFETLGVAPSTGRTFTADDARPESAPVAVVSQRVVSGVFEGRSPIGRRFTWARPDARDATWIEIVGVVPDLGMDPGDRTGRGEVFRPLVGTSFMYASVRFARDAEAFATDLRLAISAVDPRIRVTDIQPLADVGWEARAVLAGGSGLLLLLGGMALLLSLAGIYALASLAVTSRTREIGVRLALGASATDVIRTVLNRSLRQLAIGAMCGAVLAVLLSRATAILPFSIPNSIGLAVVAAGAILLAAGVLATWLPARRALRVDPMVALRSE